MPDTPETAGLPGDAPALRAENGRLREANERLRTLVEEKDAQIAALTALATTVFIGPDHDGSMWLHLAES